MKILVPVDASEAALAPVTYLESLARAGVELEVLVLNVQPRFHRHVAQFTNQAARDSMRQERSREAMARAIEALSMRKIPFRAFAEVGNPAERIAAVAEREKVDEVMMGVGRHPAWLGAAYAQRRGESLPQTAARLRTERAACRLRETLDPPADVAAEAGFCDQSHMIRSFRAVLGRTPSEVAAEIAAPAVRN